MEKVKVYDKIGRTRDERETCFPAPKGEVKNQSKGAGMQ